MAKFGPREAALRKKAEEDYEAAQKARRNREQGLMSNESFKASTAPVVLDRQVALPTRSLPETELAIADAQLQRIRDLDQQREKLNQRYWFEVKDFHTNKRWIVKGYATFDECLATELGYSKPHIYHLLGAAEVRESLDADAKVSPGILLPNVDAMTERQARELKRLPPAARVEVAKEVDFKTASTADVRQAVAAKLAPTPAPVGAPIGRLRGIVTAKPEPAVIAEAAVDEAEVFEPAVLYPSTQPNEWPNRAPVVEHITVVRVPKLQPGAPDPLVRIARADDPERLYPCPHCGTLMRVAEFIGEE